MSWIVAGLIAGVGAWIADYVMWGHVFTGPEMHGFGTMPPTPEERTKLMAANMPTTATVPTECAPRRALVAPSLQGREAMAVAGCGWQGDRGDGWADADGPLGAGRGRGQERRRNQEQRMAHRPLE